MAKVLSLPVTVGVGVVFLIVLVKRAAFCLQPPPEVVSLAKLIPYETGRDPSKPESQTS